MRHPPDEGQRQRPSPAKATAAARTPTSTRPASVPTFYPTSSPASARPPIGDRGRVSQRGTSDPIARRRSDADDRLPTDHPTRGASVIGGRRTLAPHSSGGDR